MQKAEPVRSRGAAGTDRVRCRGSGGSRARTRSPSPSLPAPSAPPLPAAPRPCPRPAPVQVLPCAPPPPTEHAAHVVDKPANSHRPENGVARPQGLCQEGQGGQSVVPWDLATFQTGVREVFVDCPLRRRTGLGNPGSRQGGPSCVPAAGPQPTGLAGGNGAGKGMPGHSWGHRPRGPRGGQLQLLAWARVRLGEGESARAHRHVMVCGKARWPREAGSQWARTGRAASSTQLAETVPAARKPGPRGRPPDRRDPEVLPRSTPGWVRIPTGQARVVWAPGPCPRHSGWLLSLCVAPSPTSCEVQKMKQEKRRGG